MALFELMVVIWQVQIAHVICIQRMKSIWGMHHIGQNEDELVTPYYAS